MTEIAVVTEDLFYCSADFAHQYAVEALLISKARDIDFYDAYYGLLSYRLSEWLEDHLQEIDGKLAAMLFAKIRQTEQSRFFLDRDENKFMMILRDEIIPLGFAFLQMNTGSNKEKALAEVRELLLYSNGNVESIRDLPKSARHLSKRKLERLWTKYSEVPHYVWLKSLNIWRITTGLEPVSYRDGREAWGRIMSTFDAVSPTKHISVSEPQFLRFMTSDEFEEALSKIPPLE